jgi:hypothetical protein
LGGCTLGWGACPLGYVAIRGSNGPPAAPALPGDTRGPAHIGMDARSTHRAIRGAFPHPKRVSIAHLACTFVLTEMHMPSFRRHTSLFITGPCFRTCYRFLNRETEGIYGYPWCLSTPKTAKYNSLGMHFSATLRGAYEFPRDPLGTRGTRGSPRDPPRYVSSV